MHGKIVLLWVSNSSGYPNPIRMVVAYCLIIYRIVLCYIVLFNEYEHFDRLYLYCLISIITVSHFNSSNG